MDDKDIQNSDPSSEEPEDDDSLDPNADNADDDSGDADAKGKNKKSAETRINELNGKLKERERELEELRNNRPVEPPITAKSDTPPVMTPEALKIINQLETLGFTRKGVVDEKFKQIEDRLTLESEHSKLGSEFDGSDGRPKYDKSKVEGYMRDHAVYDPEVAYKAMNEAELLDWHLKKAETGTKKKTYIEKPGGSGVNRSSDNQITKEKLQEVANNPTPNNRAWYEKNRDKILQMHSEGQFNS